MPWRCTKEGRAYRDGPVMRQMSPEQGATPVVTGSTDPTRAREEPAGDVSNVLVHRIHLGQHRLDRHELLAGISLVRHEEQPGVQPAQAVGAVDEVVPPA